MSTSLDKQAREWIVKNRPEPQKCSVCGQELGLWPSNGSSVCRNGVGHTFTYKCLSQSDIDDADAKRLVAFATQVREQGKWVSVAERLPEDDSDVFAAIWWINSEDPAKSHYAIHDCLYYEGGAGSGQKIFVDNEGQEFEHVDVAYWIYKKTLAETLPAPPETTEQEEK